MSKNIDINKIQSLMNAVNNGIWSQSEVMDMLYSCTQQEAKFITKTHQLFMVELNDFNDHFDVVKEMSIGGGQYEIKDLLLIEDPACIGLKRLGELGAYAANTNSQYDVEDWPLSNDCHKTFSLQALDPENLGFDNINELAKLLEFVEQNKQYVPANEAGFFKAAKDKNTKPFYTHQDVEGSVYLNGAYYAPCVTIMEIKGLEIQKSAKVIVQCLRKLVAKCGKLRMDKGGRVSAIGKKDGKKEKNKFQEHKKTESELAYLVAVKKGTEEDIISAFWNFSGEQEIDTGTSYSSVAFADIYKEWCDEKDFNEDNEFQDCNDQEVDADDSDEGESKTPIPESKKDEDDFVEEVKLDKRLLVAVDIKKDAEITKSTKNFFIDNVKVKENAYKIGAVSVPLVKDCNFTPDQFVKTVVKKQRIQSVAKLLLVEDFDLKTDIFMELYKSSDKGQIKSQLLHNVQYIAFRMANSNKKKDVAPVMDGVANVPAFVIYYEIIQCMKKTNGLVNCGVVPSGLVGVLDDVLMVYWLNELMGETGKFKAGDAGIDWFKKTYKVKFTNKTQLPRSYGEGQKKESKDQFGGGSNTSVFF